MMTGALLLLACSCFAADVDPVLSEVRALGVKVERMEGKLDNVHDGMVKLTASIEARKDQMDEDHVTLTNPVNGVVVRQTKMESSQTRHSRLLWGVATAFSGICVTVSGAWVIKRLGLRNGKNGNAKGK